MAVCRVEKNKNYTTMSNYHLRDRNLSNKARGLLSTMLSLPENWDYTTRGLAAICKDGVDGITAQLRELEQFGYLSRRRIRDENGRIVDMEYVIYEKPHPAFPDMAKQDTDLPRKDLPSLEIPAQINKDQRNKDQLNTDESIIDSIPSGTGRKRRETTVRDTAAYRETISDHLEFDVLLGDFPDDRQILEEILELIVETVCTTKKRIRVAGEDFPAEVVRARLLKLNHDHIGFVLRCLKENTTKIRNIKQYLLTTLYNAPVTMDNYYSALAQHYMANNE